MPAITKIYFGFKRLIPVRIKRVPWYIFKSPQREAGYKTIWYELRGIFEIGFRYMCFLLFNPELQPVSICTGLKNRSSNYLRFLVDSILKADHPELIELCVFDCGSDDAAALEASIRKKWKGKLVFRQDNKEFTRSYAFNRAVELSTNQIIFVSDADMSLPVNLVRLCNRYVFSKNVWFPVCFHLKKDMPASHDKMNGEWYPVGSGMFSAKKSDFIRIGMFDEAFKKWGGEDWEIWLRFYKNGFFPYRNRQKGLFHHYHPSLKPKVINPPDNQNFPEQKLSD